MLVPAPRDGLRATTQIEPRAQQVLTEITIFTTRGRRTTAEVQAADGAVLQTPECWPPLAPGFLQVASARLEGVVQQMVETPLFRKLRTALAAIKFQLVQNLGETSAAVVQTFYPYKFDSPWLIN